MAIPHQISQGKKSNLISELPSPKRHKREAALLLLLFLTKLGISRKNILGLQLPEYNYGGSGS